MCPTPGSVRRRTQTSVIAGSCHRCEERASADRAADPLDGSDNPVRAHTKERSCGGEPASHPIRVRRPARPSDLRFDNVPMVCRQTRHVRRRFVGRVGGSRRRELGGAAVRSLSRTQCLESLGWVERSANHGWHDGCSVVTRSVVTAQTHVTGGNDNHSFPSEGGRYDSLHPSRSVVRASG